MTKRVLVLASDLPPSAGVPAHGGGLRGWTLAEGLRSAGFDVQLRFPRESLPPRAAGANLAPVEPESMTFPWSNPLATLASDRPDVVVASSWLLAGHITDCPVPLVVDLAGPVLLEFLAQSPEKARALAFRKPRAIARADFVTCAGERQRHYFLAWLALSGFSPEDCARRLAVVPISCGPEKVARAPARDNPRFVFAGLPLAWQDPVEPLDALLTRLEERGRGWLDVYMGRHPVHSEGASWFPWLEKRLARCNRAALHAPLPYQQLLDEYARCDVAFDLFEHGVERELAVGTRTVDYLHAGVVPLVASYVELAPILAGSGAGLALAPPYRETVPAAVDRLLDEPRALPMMSANAQHLARERFAWDRTIAPLAEFCRSPTRRAWGQLSVRDLVGDVLAEAERHAAENLQLKSQVKDRDNELARLRDYTKTVERDWEIKGAAIREREADLREWRSHPWRRAAGATARAVSARLRGLPPGRRG